MKPERAYQRLQQRSAELDTMDLNRRPAGIASMVIGDDRMTGDLTDRLAEAAGVPVLLAVAYDVFEQILRALRGAEDQAGPLSLCLLCSEVALIALPNRRNCSAP